MIKVKSDRLVKKMDIKTIAPLEDVISLIFKYSINAGIKVDVHADTARVDNGSEENCIVIKNGVFKDDYLTYVVVQRQYGILSYANVYETGESLNAKKMSKNAQHNKKMDFVLDDLVHGGGAHGGGFKLMNMAYNKVAASANKTSEKEVEAEKMYYELVAQVVMLSLEDAGKNVQNSVNHVTADSTTQTSTNTSYSQTNTTTTQSNASTNAQNNNAKDFEKDYAEFVNSYNAGSSNGPRHIDPNGSKTKQENSNPDVNSSNTNTTANTQSTENNDTTDKSNPFAGFDNDAIIKDSIKQVETMFGTVKKSDQKEGTTIIDNSELSKDKPVPTEKKDNKKLTFGDFVVWMLIAGVIALIFPAIGIYVLGGAFILYIIAWLAE